MSNNSVSAVVVSIKIKKCPGDCKGHDKYRWYKDNFGDAITYELMENFFDCVDKYFHDENINEKVFQIRLLPNILDKKEIEEILEKLE
jgi:hypothetical protein